MAYLLIAIIISDLVSRIHASSVRRAHDVRLQKLAGRDFLAPLLRARGLEAIAIDSVSGYRRAMVALELAGIYSPHDLLNAAGRDDTLTLVESIDADGRHPLVTTMLAALPLHVAGTLEREVTRLRAALGPCANVAINQGLLVVHLPAELTTTLADQLLDAVDRLHAHGAPFRSMQLTGPAACDRP